MLATALGTPRPLPADVLAARAAVDAALRSLLAVPDAALEKEWVWRGRDEADARYGLYHVYEQLEKGQAAALAVAGRPTQAGAVLGQATAALWDLHGLLIGLDDGVLDRDPGGGEWTIRQTLAHVISVQRSYASHTAYGVHRQRTDPALPLRTPDEFYTRVPDEELVEGDLTAIRRRMDEYHDAGVGLLAAVDDDAAMATGTIWAGFEVSVRFRLHRWGSHFREHTIQVEKTLAAIGHQPTEVARIVRITAHAYGRLEGEVLARPGAEAALVPALVNAVERAGAHARELLAAAG